MGFPEKFLWGVAISNVQSEGAILEDGKGLNVYDVYHTPEEAVEAEIAVDHYHHYKEDIKLMAELGIKAFRFAIVWSRIHPNGDDENANEKGLDFYESLVDELLKYGIEPVASLVHFDMPLHLSKKYNGFFNRETADLFGKHVEAVVNRLQGKVTYWITFNEINTAIMMHDLVAGVDQPSENPAENVVRISSFVQLAHAKAVAAIKRIDPKAQVGGMIAYTPFYPETNHPNDIYLAEYVNKFANHLQLDMMCYDKIPTYFERFAINNGLDLPLTAEDRLLIEETTIDYIAYSYYKTDVVNSHNRQIDDVYHNPVAYMTDTPKNNYVKATEWDWQIDPLGLRYVSADLTERYHLPIFLVENGIGLREELTSDGQIIDDARIAYLTDHISEMEKSMTYDGSHILGYLAWTGFDFLSSKKEMTKRYGFVYVNRTNEALKDLKRLKKKSFSWYSDVIKKNGL